MQITNGFTIEVVASTVESCIRAQKGGARRIELCSALGAAGITPSSGFIQLSKQYVTIPVFVLIRPREGHFTYSRTEREVIRRDIENSKVMGADGVVFGALDEDQEVDIDLMKRVVEWSAPLPVTFHRAIDLTTDMQEALEMIIDTGCSRVLTSGGKTSAIAGKDVITSLVERAAGRIAIMPGAGINAENFGQLLHQEIHDYHLSARSTFQPSGGLFEMNYGEADTDIIRSVVKQAKSFFFPG